MDTSETIAALAFGLATFSLLWQLYYAVRLDRARLRAKVVAKQIFPPGVQVVAMTVTNIGRRATFLQSTNLVLGKPHRLRDHVWPKSLRRPYALLPFAPEELSAYNSSLPKRLEPGDEANVYVRRETVESALRKEEEKWVHVQASASTARTRKSRPTRIEFSATKGSQHT